MNKDANLIHAAACDITYRSRIGLMFYLIIFAIVVGFAPFNIQQTFITTLIGLPLLAGTVIRGISVWKFHRLYSKNPKLWRVISSTGALIQGATWGLFCIVSIHYYEWQWPTMVVSISAAAFSAGAVTTLSPMYSLTAAYLALMLVPTLVYSLAMASEPSLIAALLFSTYFVFLLHIAKRLNKEYWSLLHNTRLLTERAKQLEMKNKELETFAYSVSHDLRAPLRAIDGFSDILLEDASYKLDETECNYLHRIRVAAQQMDYIIDGLLQLSKVSSAECMPRKINLSNLVKDNLELLRQRDPLRHVEFVIEPDVYTQGDQSLMNIAMGILAENAWKYSSKRNYSKIRFGSRRDNDEIIYYIKDDGAGFDTRYSNKLFKPFQRLHTNDEFPGTGVGLATVYRIIERHSGRVWANAKINKGATFYFTLHGERCG